MNTRKRMIRKAVIQSILRQEATIGHLMVWHHELTVEQKLELSVKWASCLFRIAEYGAVAPVLFDIKTNVFCTVMEDVRRECGCLSLLKR